MDREETDALLALSLTPGIGPAFIHRGCAAFGSAVETLAASPTTLARHLPRLSSNRAGKLHRAIQQTRDDGAVARELELIGEHEVALIAWDDARYPRLLKLIPDPPPLLWVRGALEDEDALALGIVGSRKCTHYGREQTARLAQQAAQAGLCVVSGGAYGIDIAAHRAALDAGGRTLAVLGSGLANPYPKPNVPVFERIAGGEGGASRGAVLSELPMETAPVPENFPRRNRIVSGLSLGILVIEAAKRSGALITARLCVEEHGRELLALPGRVDSRLSDGCHQMIRDGWAKLVTNIADVLDALGEAGQTLKASMSVEPGGDGSGGGAMDVPSANLSESQRKIVAALDEPRNLEQLAVATHLGAGVLQADLTMLELWGLLERRGDQFVRRAAQTAS